MNKRIVNRYGLIGVSLLLPLASYLAPAASGQTYFDSDYTAAEVEALLDKVDALATVSQAEAEAGIATTDRLWTAERVAQAVAALSSATIDGLTDTTITALGDGELLVSSGGNWINQTLAEVGITTDLVSDLTPQLGGPLDLNGQEIQSAGDVVFQLGDNAGVNKLSIQDSDSAEVASIDSNGGIIAPSINWHSTGDLATTHNGAGKLSIVRMYSFPKLYWQSNGLLSMPSTGKFGWSSDSNSAAVAADVYLQRDAANTLALRNGTAGQAFNLYETYTDASNYSRMYSKFDTSRFEIGTEAAGTGTGRSLTISAIGPAVDIRIAVNGTDWWRFNRFGDFFPNNTGQDIGASSLPVQDLYLYRTLELDQGTVTDPTPAIDITSTWNDAADTMALIQANVTDTASAADSLLMDLQVGGSPVFQVGKDGDVNISGDRIISTDSNFYVGRNVTTAHIEFEVDNDVKIRASKDLYLNTDSLYFGESTDVHLSPNGTNILAQHNATSAQEFQIFNTYTDASNGEWLELGFQDTTNTAVIKTNANGTGTVRNLEVYAGSAKAFTITSSGTFSIDKNLLPSGNNNKDLGNSSAYWRSLYLGSYLYQADVSADPSNPANGSHVIWQSDGTGSGDDGDIMLKITDSGGTTKTITLVDYSAF